MNLVSFNGQRAGTLLGAGRRCDAGNGVFAAAAEPISHEMLLRRDRGKGSWDGSWDWVVGWVAGWVAEGVLLGILLDIMFEILLDIEPEILAETLSKILLGS
ncbi:hypothetical protein GQ602_003605 [Ophiocordyceps camponoti-floridani]|uniref:Uncharacterized protein n=1 Tax=Ophiocordyceps camponoti-floridani TaxID=2030778 RepID=A0A8H4Q8G1_9HYPO|nr:hypothetical protein GQ602_003605 [Ophiocordyceps camponoti-floridani]